MCDKRGNNTHDEAIRRDERQRIATKIQEYFGYIENNCVDGKKINLPFEQIEIDILLLLSQTKESV
jgi:hypothetical protein